MTSMLVDDILVCLFRSALLLSGNPDFSDSSSIDWVALVTRAQQQGLAPLLYVSLKRLESRIQPPANFVCREYAARPDSRTKEIA